MKTLSGTLFCSEKNFWWEENKWIMTGANIAGTVTAITLLSILVKCFAQPVMEKAKIPSLIRFGVARATTGLVKNVTAFAKR